jgi:hypothetical protein
MSFSRYLNDLYAPLSVISVIEVNLAKVPRALEGEVKGVVVSRGRVRCGCGVNPTKHAGTRLRRAARRRALIPFFLSVNVLVSFIAVNQINPYDSSGGNGGSEFPSRFLPFNDPNYETYKRGQQFITVNCIAN